jgi:ribosomal subunit interface protein
MNILFTTRHTSINDDLKSYCEDRLQKLSRYINEPATIEVRFEDIRGGQKAGNDNLVCITITQPHQKNPFHIEKTTGDYRSSFDIARDHLENHLRRQRVKIRIKKRLPRIDKLMFWKRG